MSDEIAKIAIFQKREIRKQLHDGEWWFAVHDIVTVLTESTDSGRYLRNLRARDQELAALFEPVEKGASQIAPPFFCYPSARLAVCRNCWHGTRKDCSV